MMLGVDDCPLNLGVIPSAIAWLYRLVDERRQSTGARFSVRVSAIEVTGREETTKDLLANVTASAAGIQRLQSKFGERAFSYSGPHSWNDLPLPLRQATSLPAFKKTFLLDAAFC